MAKKSNKSKVDVSSLVDKAIKDRSPKKSKKDKGEVDFDIKTGKSSTEKSRKMKRGLAKTDAKEKAPRKEKSTKPAKSSGKAAGKSKGAKAASDYTFSAADVLKGSVAKAKVGSFSADNYAHAAHSFAKSAASAVKKNLSERTITRDIAEVIKKGFGVKTNSSKHLKALVGEIVAGSSKQLESKLNKKANELRRMAKKGALTAKSAAAAAESLFAE